MRSDLDNSRCIHVNKILAFHDGLLTKEVEEFFISHMSSCEICNREYKKMCHKLDVVETKIPELVLTCDKIVELQTRLVAVLKKTETNLKRRSSFWNIFPNL